MPPLEQQIPGFLAVVAVIAVTLASLWVLGGVR